MGDYSIGVDLGGTNLRIAAVDSDGKLMEKLTLGAEVSRGREFVITEMCKAIESLRTKYQGLRRIAGHRNRRTWLHRHGCRHGHGVAQSARLEELPRARRDRTAAGHQGHP